jgi:hypothetical protein
MTEPDVETVVTAANMEAAQQVMAEKLKLPAERIEVRVFIAGDERLEESRK